METSLAASKMKIRAAVLEKYTDPKTNPGPLQVLNLDLDHPRAREVLVRVAGAGICHSDLAVVAGIRKLPLPIALGHECSGYVEETGSEVTRVKKGDPVVISYVPSCGRCVYCASGLPALCDLGRSANSQGILLDGGTRIRDGQRQIHHHLGVSAFSDHVVVSEQAVIPMKVDFAIEKLALFGCAVLTGIGAVVNSARVQAGRTVAVFGCGGVGLNVIQGSHLAGARQIIAIDVLDSKLAMSKTFGATDTVNSSRDDPVEQIRNLTGGLGVDYSFEAIGNTKVMEIAFRSTKKSGETIVVGITSPEEKLTIPSSILVDQQRVLKGSFMGSAVPQRDIPILVDLYVAGRIKIDELISKYIELDDVNKGINSLAGGEVARQIIRF
jgi:alcohol dehydrogenase